MKIKGKTVLLCNCGASMNLDARGLARHFGDDEPARIHHQLCRSELAGFQQALDGAAPILVGCTQEAPLFADVAAATNDVDLDFVNIRERAGWSAQGAAAGPKIAALLAEAALEVPPTAGVQLRSEGRTLIYGRDEVAIDAARQLIGRLDVTLVLDRPERLVPPPVSDLPIFRGSVAKADGHLGAFRLVFDDFAPYDPTARRGLVFEVPHDGEAREFDLILDLTPNPPLFSGSDYRDGYVKPDAGNPALVQRALFDLTDLVGAFDKPRYIAYRTDICAHSRNRQIGCRKCLDLCPADAIRPDGDGVAIDPYVCGGCGLCASVCPTGAATYDLPPVDHLFERLRLLLTGYRAAGGRDPVVLCHNPRNGDEMIAVIARFGRGLPANVLPFAVNEVSQIGFDLIACALAFGAMRVVMLTSPAAAQRLAGLAAQIGLAEAVCNGLGYGPERVGLIDDADPDQVAGELYRLAARRADLPPDAGGNFLPVGGKRERMRLALEGLHADAPSPVDNLALPPGAPFGSLAVDTAGCTLCLACVGACPTGALSDNPDRPQLGFREIDCVQCGLCRVTCPESVISLTPRLDFTELARERTVLNDEDPANCVRCGKPFGVQSTVDRMVEKLHDHSMFADDPAALDRIRMCEDCRVAVQFEAKAPMAGAPRPKPRTSDDYRQGLADDDTS